MCMCTSLTRSFNDLSLGRADTKITTVKGRLLKFQVINFKKLEGVDIRWVLCANIREQFIYGLKEVNLTTN